MRSLPAAGPALELFRKVILASASVPGLFDPVYIDAEANGHQFKEMHVDGELIDPNYMRALFELGRDRGRLGGNWEHVPPKL